MLRGLPLARSLRYTLGMASLTHTQTCSVLGGLYRVSSAITDATDVPEGVFVFATDSGEFSRVASVSDLMNLKPSRAEAQGAHAEYYRLPTVTRDFAALTIAREFATMVTSRLPPLVRGYTEATDNFVGSTTTVVSS